MVGVEREVEHRAHGFAGVAPSPLFAQQAVTHQHFTIGVPAQTAPADPRAVVRSDRPTADAQRQLLSDVSDPFARGLCIGVRDVMHIPQHFGIAVQHLGHRVGDEAGGDRRAVVVQDRHQAGWVHLQFVDQQAAQLAVPVLLDDEDLLMRSDEFGHRSRERERPPPPRTSVRCW